MELNKVKYQGELESADKEVIEAYKTLTSLKLKKKPATKKEKDAAFKALETRNAVLKKFYPESNSNDSCSKSPSRNLAPEVKMEL